METQGGKKKEDSSTSTLTSPLLQSRASRHLPVDTLSP